MHRILCRAAGEVVQLKYPQAACLGLEPHRVGLAAGFFGPTKYADDLVAAVEKGLECRLAKILLSDDDNFHDGVRVLWATLR